MTDKKPDYLTCTLDQYLGNKGWLITDVEIGGVSGSSDSGCTALSSLLADAQEKKYDAVVEVRMGATGDRYNQKEFLLIGTGVRIQHAVNPTEEEM